MTFYVKIELGNDAMQNGRDVAVALRKVAGKVYGCDANGTDWGNRIADENGNKVGEWGFTEEEVKVP